MTEETKKNPSLLALLLCERVETAPDGVHSLIRVFDRSVINLEVAGDAPGPVVSTLEFSVFVKWGCGVGHFNHFLEITDPSGKSVRTPEVLFWLPNTAAGHQIITRVRLGVKQGGRYLLRAFLDGTEVAEGVLIVDFNLRRK